VFKLRDACLLLTGHRPYREYPVEWMIRSLESSGYVIDTVRLFPISWGLSGLTGQLDACEQELLRHQDVLIMPTEIKSTSLKRELQSQVRGLRQIIHNNEVIRSVGICYGVDYVISAHIS